MENIDFKPNTFGELQAKWQNNIHPDNKEFMQVVFWTAYIKPDGRFAIGYTLEYGRNLKIVERGEGTIQDLKSLTKKYC